MSAAAAAPSGGQSASDASWQEELQQRMDQIAARGPRTISREEAEYDAAVVEQCRYLMLLLSHRQRSEGELRQRLRAREVPARIAQEALARADRAGLIDDLAFAREYVRQGRAGRGLADEALRRALLRREVSQEVIDEALGGEEPSAHEERARALIRERLRREKNLERVQWDPSHRHRVGRRLDGYLRRRGYDGALAVRVISSELRAAVGR